MTIRPDGTRHQHHVLKLSRSDSNQRLSALVTFLVHLRVFLDNAVRHPTVARTTKPVEFNLVVIDSP